MKMQIFHITRTCLLRICLFSVFINVQFIILQISADIGVSTEVIVHPHNLQIQVKWNSSTANNSKVDVTVAPQTDYCYQGVCIADGINMTLGNIVLPRHSAVMHTLSECTVEPGCNYTITVETQNRKEIGKTVFHVPDCNNFIDSLCTCRVPLYPNISIFAEQVDDMNTIKISWNLQNQNNTKNLGHNNLQLTITIYNKTNPSLSWGGKLEFLGMHNFTIEGSYLAKEQIITGFKIHKLSKENLYRSHFLVEGQIMDTIGCISRKKRFPFYVTRIQNNPQVTSEIYKSQFLTIIIPCTVLASIILLFSSFVYKRIKKARSVTTNWGAIHRNVNTSNIARTMEDNLLYLDKDVLNTQKRETGDLFEIPHSSIKISHEIGKGAFGRVFKATVENLQCKPGITTVAVKQLKKKPLPAEIEEFLSEIQMMKNAGNHENIVTLIGCCTLKEPYMMIMEFVGQGDLLQYLRNIRNCYNKRINNSIKYKTENEASIKKDASGNSQQRQYLQLQFSSASTESERSHFNQTEINPTSTSPLRPSFTETMYTSLSHDAITNQPTKSYMENSSDFDNKEFHNFAIQIARGMQHLEEKGITHRDLAARNILIDEHKTLKISDFGLSRAGIYVKPRDKVKLLPLRWLSIEAIHDNFYSSKSDVWAFGIVLWEIGTLGAFPYPTLSNTELLEFLFSGKRLDKPEICTNYLYDLMLRCWDDDPNERPSFSDICKDLQEQNQKTYININDLQLNYVFPPTKEDTILNN